MAINWQEVFFHGMGSQCWDNSISIGSRWHGLRVRSYYGSRLMTGGYWRRIAAFLLPAMAIWHGSCSRIPGPGRAPIRRIIFTTEFHPDRGRMDRSGPSFWWLSKGGEISYKHEDQQIPNKNGSRPPNVANRWGGKPRSVLAGFWYSAWLFCGKTDGWSALKDPSGKIVRIVNQWVFNSPEVSNKCGWSNPSLGLNLFSKKLASW